MQNSSSRGRSRIACMAGQRSLRALAGAVAAVILADVSLIVSAPQAEAKTPGSTYCFYGTCHRVKSIAETEALVGSDTTLASSFYDSCKNDRYNPCGLTSSGERFEPDTPDNAASPIYPDGTELLVWSPATGDAAVLRVNNAGPYWGERKLDVSRAAAEQLGFKGSGTARLKVRVIDAPTRAEATYSRGRKYEPVLGYIGRYASLEEASSGLASMMALDALATATRRPLGNAVSTARAELVTESRTTMLAKADPVEPKPTKTAARRKHRVETARLGIPIIDEVIKLTDDLLGVNATAKAPSATRRIAARKTHVAVAAAERPTRTKAKTRVASVGSKKRAKKPTPVQVARAEHARPRPVTDEASIHHSISGQYATASRGSVLSRARQQAANTLRARRPS